MSSNNFTIFQNAALLFLRLVIASIFLFSAWAKWSFLKTDPEAISVQMRSILFLLTIFEPLGAIALILGLWTRWAAAGLGIIMIGAIVSLSRMQIGYFTSDAGPGFDYNVLILAGCLVLIVFGAGRWSLDAIWKNKKN